LEQFNHILHEVPKEGRLLACTNLSCPILEYTDIVWNSTLAKDIAFLEMIQ